jgi:hypothetical protein
MKTKLIMTVLLTVIGLMLVLGGTTHAQSGGDYKIYLPLVSNQYCTFVTPTLYASVSSPVVRVGEIVTVTEVLVNDCAHIGPPLYNLWAQPEGILTPSLAFKPGVPPGGIANGSYQVITFTTQAIEPGVVTISTGSSFEVTMKPPQAFFLTVGANPIVMRVLP